MEIDILHWILLYWLICQWYYAWLFWDDLGERDLLPVTWMCFAGVTLPLELAIMFYRWLGKHVSVGLVDGQKGRVLTIFLLGTNYLSGEPAGKDVKTLKRAGYQFRKTGLGWIVKKTQIDKNYENRTLHNR